MKHLKRYHHLQHLRLLTVCNFTGLHSNYWLSEFRCHLRSQLLNHVCWKSVIIMVPKNWL